MLINATQPEEIRVALIKGAQLFDLDVERAADIKKKSNIYKCRITRIEPSLEAVFVEYGSKRQGFLPVKEISPTYFLKTPNPEGQLNIREVLREGQELMVQVDKEERGNKGAALTTYITLAGCFLVLMPNNPASGGISRRIEGNERDEVRDALQMLEVPEGMGLIIRTAGVGKSEEDLKWDLNVLLNQWNAIFAAYEQQPAPFLIYQEGDVIIRSIRDNLRRSIEEIIIDDHVAYAKAKNYITQIKPDFLPHLKLYNDHVPLFSRYQIEGQIEDANHRTVSLPSGGSIVIDRTEALVAIDINSAKSTSGSDIEHTAYNTNLEAADEIARQLRLRDLAGLIVIDFIDMFSSRNQREVENRLRDAVASDRAKIQIARISRFGLLEMSRQRLRLSLNESIQEICVHCDGKGVMRRPESQALSLIRLIEEEASKEAEVEIQVQLPVDIATFILNEKRLILTQIEKRHQVNLVVLPNMHMNAIQYKISRAKKEDRNKPSFEQVTLPELNIIQTDHSQKAQEKPAVQSTTSSFNRVSEPKVATLLKCFNTYVKRLSSLVFNQSPEKATSTNSADTAHHTPGRRPANRGNQQRRRQPQSRQHQSRSPNSEQNQEQRTEQKKLNTPNRSPRPSNTQRSISPRTQRAPKEVTPSE